jgi:Glycosyltransferase
MRIGLDARTTTGETGVAQYGRNLVKYLPVVDQADEFILLKNNSHPVPFWSSQLGFRSQLLRSKLDLLHVLGGAPPVFYRGKFVLTVHDLIIYRHPEWFPDGQWFSTRFAYPQAVRAASHIIVPSKATKNDLMEIFKIKEEKITVIPHGVSTPPLLNKERSDVRSDSDLTSEAGPAPHRRGASGAGVRYILFLGTIEPRKNISTLVKAYRKMVDNKPELKDVELIIAGTVGWKSDLIVDEIRKTQCEGYKIKLTGRVTEAEKWRLMRGASCLALPSFYEGFGMQVLESMASGAPVVCSNTSSLPEAAGGAALLLDPLDVKVWIDGLIEILENKKFADELRAKGLARASEMTWEKTTAATVAVYRRFSA